MSASPLPAWPAGTVCVLTTIGADGPHAIPVSAALRAGEATILLALARTRASLDRLRAEPRVALAVAAGPDLAFTARGQAHVAADPLPGAEAVAAVEIAVDGVDRHERATFAIDGGVSWRWTDALARERDAAVRAALIELASTGARA
jgi:hypothetical protein